MANGRNSGSDREAMLRRVAIVLSNLPAPIATELLGSVDPQSRQAVRRTMTSLADVDPLERRRALQAFKGLIEQPPATVHPASQSPGGVEDEVVIGRSASTPQPTSRVVSSSVARNASISDPSPLAFLGDVDDDTLISLLSVEHPQAIALVLASIAPNQAARVLPRLDPRVQTDALSRIGRLGDIPEATVVEVAEHFRTQVAQQSRAEQSATGQRALNAILAALPSSVANSPATIDPASPTTGDADEARQPPIAPVSFPSADVPAIDLTHKLRVAEHSWPEPPVELNHQTESTSSSAIDRQPSDRPASDLIHGLQAEPPAAQQADESLDRAPSLDSTDAIHQHLLRLPPSELCQALGRIDTRYAMLALCGLPTQVAESVFAMLPRAQAKQVRIQMNSLGSLHLREIDEAKEKVAHASLASGDEQVSHVPLAA